MSRPATQTFSPARASGRASPGPQTPSLWRAVWRRVTGDTVIQLAVIAVLLMAWETVTRLGLVHPFLLPRLSAVIERI